MITSYYITTFDNTTAVMQAEAALNAHFPVTVMPVPREISSGCGLCLRFLDAAEPDIKEYLKTFPIQGRLYKMKSTKENGHYPLEHIMTFP